MDQMEAFKLLSIDDRLSKFREEFSIPSNRSIHASTLSEDLGENPCAYFAGNSLGLQPKRSRQLVLEELEAWASRGVEGHFDHPHSRPWTGITDKVHPFFAELVGAKESEVVCMGTLTANLHLMMDAFYKPTATRFKILCEAKAFPSDQYAFASQVSAHGYTPSDAIIELSPRSGEFTLRKEDILETIKNEGSSIALVLLSGVQYYTGQFFPIQEITKAAKDQGCTCGWDLAHAVGNVPLSLHDWDVDFAVWCTYKYLNSGPGGIAGLFVHEARNGQPIRQAGWWGHDPATRFAMPPHFSAIPGAQGFQQSNPSVLAVAALLGSLQVFHEAGGMVPLRARSMKLTSYLEAWLHCSPYWIPSEHLSSTPHQKNIYFTIITPPDPSDRGSQLSLLFLPANDVVMPKVLKGLATRGVIGDSRKPDVIRLAPCPLYNNWEDIERVASALNEVLGELELNGIDK